MTTIAVIGLGVMGGPMAANLVKAGYDVVGDNRSAAKVNALVSEGGRGAASVAEAVKDAPGVLTVLPDSPDVEGGGTGGEGGLAAAAAGPLWGDSRTLH